jgi:hypothetical protein
MDTCHHLIGNTWRWHSIWQNLLKILTKFDAKDRFVIIAYHRDQRCNYPLIFIYIVSLLCSGFSINFVANLRSNNGRSIQMNSWMNSSEFKEYNSEIKGQFRWILRCKNCHKIFHVSKARDKNLEVIGVRLESN